MKQESTVHSKGNWINHISHIGLSSQMEQLGTFEGPNFVTSVKRLEVVLVAMTHWSLWKPELMSLMKNVLRPGESGNGWYGQKGANGT